MSTRINIAETDPKAYKAMMGLEAYLAGAGLDQTLKELIKIRASQINGCAFCIDMHSRDALKRGETPQRLFLLSAWREAGNAFSDNHSPFNYWREQETGFIFATGPMWCCRHSVTRPVVYTLFGYV